jgi:Bacterial Ig-like domain (group 2)
MGVFFVLALSACKGERTGFTPMEVTNTDDVQLDAAVGDEAVDEAPPTSNLRDDAGDPGGEGPTDEDSPGTSDASAGGEPGDDLSPSDDGTLDDMPSDDGTLDDMPSDDGTLDDMPSDDGTLDDSTLQSDAGTSTPPAKLVALELLLSDNTLTSLGVVSYQVLCTYAGIAQSQDCTNDASVDAANPAMVSIDTGSVTALMAGTTELVATLNDVGSNPVTFSVDLETPNALIAITVTAPAPELSVGLSQSLTAQCAYPNETTDCTELVTWSSAEPYVVAINEAGLVTALMAGTTVVSASLDGVDSNPIDLTVTPAILTSITLSPSPVATVEVGTTRPFEASCISSDDSVVDCTTSVTWVSSVPEIVSVDAGGIAFGADTGASVVSATLSGVSSSNVTVTVIPPPGCDDIIDFPDPSLLTDIREDINKPSGAIYYADVKSLTFFEHATINGQINDLTGLRCLTGLTTLYLEECFFTDISELIGLTRVTDLSLRWSTVASVPNLSSMTNLTNLNLTGTSITDLFSLLETTSLGEGDTVNVQNTNIDCNDPWITGQITELMDRGVTVYHNCTI